MPVIPALVILRQEDPEFEASLGYIVRTPPPSKIKPKQNSQGLVIWLSGSTLV
jgi:hypothetical protein